MLKKIHREEGGWSMVVSLLVTMVVLILSTIVVGQSIHALNASGYDRKRITSVAAAEAGLNYWFSYLQTTPAASLDCSAKTQTIASEPAQSSFSAEAIFYNASSSVVTCPFSNTTYPSYALITSTGSVNNNPARKMQTYVRLTPDYGGFGAAILANTGTSLGNNFDIYGQNGNDGDVYVLQGDLAITNTPNIRGNVYVPFGGLTMDNNNTIWGSVFTRDAVVTDSTIKGSVWNETGGISGTGSIGGSATSGGAIASSVTVSGTKSPNTFVPATPTKTFPTIGYVATDWTSVGYTVYTPPAATACSSALNYIKSTWASGDLVVRIGAPATACTFANGNNDTITLKGNLAIITDWGIDLSSRSDWNGVSGLKKLHFISTAPAASCPASGPTNKNVVVGNLTNFDAFTNVFFYTPCTATMSNQNNYKGQVMGATVNLANNYSMTYTPVLVPGVSGIVGFKQDIAYVREVI
ncbi:MAG TPA: hypothetical protein VGR41_10020 [Actinomycetota bacterium]|jgi:hypothetical protein|nr:hypothetical protein [Actinomycetota bacterium]